MFLYIFKSLYKNDIIIEQRKRRPIWLALIFFILSIVLTAIPNLVRGYQSRGSSFYTAQTNYDVDRGFIAFAKDKFDAVVSEDKKLVVTDTRLLNTYDEVSPVPIVYKQSNYTANDQSEPVEAILLSVYYYDADPLINKTAQTTYNNWVNDCIYKFVEGKPTAIPHSFLVITKSYFTINLFSPINTAVTNKPNKTFSGLYDKSVGFNFNSLEGATATETNKNIIKFLNTSYESTKVKTTWLNIGIYSAMNLIIILIASAILFFSLRGKNSIYKEVSYLDGLKISFTAAFTPAIIALVLSFLFGNNSMVAPIAFLMPYLFRIMFMLSRSRSKPGDNKPIYQART